MKKGGGGEKEGRRRREKGKLKGEGDTLHRESDRGLLA